MRDVHQTEGNHDSPWFILLHWELIPKVELWVQKQYSLSILDIVHVHCLYIVLVGVGVTELAQYKDSALQDVKVCELEARDRLDLVERDIFDLRELIIIQKQLVYSDLLIHAQRNILLLRVDLIELPLRHL